MNPELELKLNNLKEELKRDFERQIREHQHDGNQATQIKYFDMFGEAPSNILLRPATIAVAAGNNDDYIIAPISGRLVSVDFSALAALAANDTNYITWTITNLGQAGAGTTAMLAATNANTTKATGGTAIVADTKRTLTPNATGLNARVVEGDRLLIRAAVTGTLANTVTFPTYLLRFK